jgi:CBS domain-containing protein
MTVPVSVLLERKGTTCHTIDPDASLAEVTRRLVEHGIGALVVSRDGSSVAGVISERDVVRAVADHGEQALRMRVSDLMAAPAITCTPETRTHEVMVTMTERRVRHLPVLADGRLAGVISIGDVVKWRMDELAEDAERLQEYVSGTY